jgi:hypothetical protein
MCDWWWLSCRVELAFTSVVDWLMPGVTLLIRTTVMKVLDVLSNDDPRFLVRKQRMAAGVGEDTHHSPLFKVQREETKRANKAQISRIPADNPHGTSSIRATSSRSHHQSKLIIN